MTDREKRIEEAARAYVKGTASGHTSVEAGRLFDALVNALNAPAEPEPALKPCPTHGWYMGTSPDCGGCHPEPAPPEPQPGLVVDIDSDTAEKLIDTCREPAEPAPPFDHPAKTEHRREPWDEPQPGDFDPLAVTADWDSTEDIAYKVAQAAMAHERARRPDEDARALEVLLEAARYAEKHAQRFDVQDMLRGALKHYEDAVERGDS